VGVPVELVPPVIARGGGLLLERVLLGDHRAEQRGHGHSEPGDRCEELLQRVLVQVAVHVEVTRGIDLAAAALPWGRGARRTRLLLLSHRLPPHWFRLRPVRSPSACEVTAARFARATEAPGSRLRTDRTVHCL